MSKLTFELIMAKTKKNISEINGKARIRESEQGGKVSKGNFTELKNHSSYKQNLLKRSQIE